MISSVQSHLQFSSSHSGPIAVGSTCQRRQQSGYREREGLVRCARRLTGVPHKTNTSNAQSVSYKCTAFIGGEAAGGRESWRHYTGTGSIVPVRPVLWRHTLRLAIKNRYPPIQFTHVCATSVMKRLIIIIGKQIPGTPASVRKQASFFISF